MKRAVGTLLVFAAFSAAGCGDDNGGGSTAPTPAPAPSPPSAGGAKTRQTLILTADPGGALKFDKTSLSASAGTVRIVLKNPSSVPHAIELEGNGIEEEGKTVTKGGISDVTADLRAGTYEYYCPVDNHKEAGMEGKLTVR
jgi:plastocyanin